MQKNTLYIVLGLFCLNFPFYVHAQANLYIIGRVFDINGSPLKGVTISLKGEPGKTITDKQGQYKLPILNLTGTLIFSNIGFVPQERIYNKDRRSFDVTLTMAQNRIDEVEVVSTGYQNIPKERATGSFTDIDEELINRSTGLNILDRLQGVTSGLNTTPRFDGTNDIKIHGLSTIFSSTAPLIVLNGFPYEGTIDQINPADIESVNILKDAAASSIWGSRSGNGVIVITTKMGKSDQKATVELVSSLSTKQKPDLYYIPQMSASDFIYLESLLFSKGFYNSQINIPYRGISDAVQIFYDAKRNIISPADSALRIGQLINNDVRKDLNRHVYRNTLEQQYLLNISGGSKSHRYYVSGGFDRNLAQKRPNSLNRYSVNANNIFSVLNDRVVFTADIGYSSIENNSNSHNYDPKSPYDRLADDQGNPLAVTGKYTFRKSYADTVGFGKLLDWQYRPLDEMERTNNRSKQIQYKLHGGLSIKIIEGLSVSADYQYLEENNNINSFNIRDSYYTRNQINIFSELTENGIQRVIPIGDILNARMEKSRTMIFRPQISLNKEIGQHSIINAIVGYEGSDGRASTNSHVFYGYDPDTKTNSNNKIDPQRNYPYYYDKLFGTISTAPTEREYININQSFYTNIGYTYKERYTLSGSARKDESNIFGVKTNQKGVPLWSAGLLWDISKEDFFRIKAISSLKIRGTYGHNGNVNRSVSALTTAFYSDLLNFYGNPTGQIFNPPNPSLRWEKVKTGNLGLDFGILNQAVTGSIDVYSKKSIDLISNNPIARQSGIGEFMGNGATLVTKGLDFVLNSNWNVDKFNVTTTFLFNYNTNKVTNYLVKQSSNWNIINNAANPLEGYPVDAIFSFPSLQLDNTGAVQGVLDGAPSKDYTKILNQLDPSQLTFHGRGSPKYFGSLINTIRYREIEFSFNLTYKFGYHFRRSNVFSGSNYGTSSNTLYNLSDFSERWQNQGDEGHTRIPALTYPQNSLQDLFFGYSDFLVENGSHIRLQDMRCSYTLPSVTLARYGLQQVQIFGAARNLGILWRANKRQIDPDFGTTVIPQPPIISFGMNIKI